MSLDVKSIIMIALVVGLVAIVAVIGSSYYLQNQTSGFMGMGDAKPWIGLNCDGMLDFSASEMHDLMHDSMHMEFHQHYISNCSEP